MLKKLRPVAKLCRQSSRLLKATLTLIVFVLASLGTSNARAHLPACNGAAYCSQVQAYNECNAYTRTEHLPDPVLRDECRSVEPYSSSSTYDGKYQYFFWLPDGHGGERGPYADEYFYYRKDLGDKEGNRGKPACSVGCFGDPINAGMANKFETHSEYRGEGEFPLEMEWTYNSSGASSVATATDQIFGRNRSHTYARRVSLSSIGNTVIAYVSRPDGNTLRFDQSGSLWVGAKNRPTKLYSDVVGGSIAGWLLTDGKGGAEIFDGAGRLVELIDAQGRKQSLSYDGSGRLSTVTDMAGRALSLEYESATLLSKLNLPDGSFVRFYYSADDDLERVEYPGGVSIQYRYDEAGYAADTSSRGALTGVIDEAGSRYSNTTYDASGRAVSTFAPGNLDAHAATYQSAVDGTYFNQATISLPGGAVRQLTFTSLRGLVLPASSYTFCTDCTATQTFYSYDTNGWPDTATTNGVMLDLDYDANGHLTKKVDAATDSNGRKRTTQTDWHATLDVPVERRLYNAADVLIAKSTWTYNTRGQALTASQIDPATSTARTTTMAYCEQADVTAGTCPRVGLVTSVDGARTDVADTTTYAYYSSDDPTCAAAPTTCPHRKGDLWKVTNAQGHVIEALKYDGAGRTLSVKDADGVVTDLEYHPRGWLSARKMRGANNTTEADDQITQVEYWPTGLVKKVIQPGGAFTSYTYDAAHRLTDIADNAGNTIHYTLDNIGNRTKEEAKDSSGTLKRTLSRIFNQIGQVRTLLDAQAHPTNFNYDANGNQQSAIDALNHNIYSSYDSLNRLVLTRQDIYGINAQTQFAYDAKDNLTKVTDPKGLDTTYQYNGLGDLTQLTSPDTGTTTYTYDSAGNRKTQTDARGIVSTYSYDALNRLTGIAYPTSSLNVGYVYDTANPVCTAGETFAIGRLTQMTDSSGHTQYCYDRFGNLTRKRQTTNGHVFELRYAYTKAGQLQAITYPDGAIVDYVRDGQGRTTEVGVTPAGGTRQVLLHQATYHPFGPVAGWSYGNGRTMARPLNQNYQPTAVVDNAAGGLSLGYTFDAVGNLSQLSNADQSAILAHYGYDALNRLTDVMDGPTNTVIEHYGYDATGNRTSLTNAGGTTGYTYPTSNHRLTQVGATARSYDNAGNTTQIGGTAKEFVYNDAGRMSQIKAGGAPAMNYQLNGRGEQVRKYLGTNSTYTVYDEAGRWIGDYDTAGNPIQQAIWLDDLPVGLLVSNQLKYLQPDHLGTPRVVIDPATDVAIWTWELKGEAFGNTAPNQDPDGNGTAFVLNMRFPGQRYDVASALNYNYLRDAYEPLTGRYSQSDPIGLNGGISTYSYANSSPLKLTDPKGLMWFGPTCTADQRAHVISQIIQLSNEIKNRANYVCKGDGCDFGLAAKVLEFIAHKAYFSCDRKTPCASLVDPQYVYLYPPYIGAPDSSKISNPGSCGCFKSALFHEAAHAVLSDADENTIRRETIKCVPCATNVTETGGPL